jgi:hypothetical protein
MKFFSLCTLLCMIAHTSLYLMDDPDDIQLTEKAIQKITACMTQCIVQHHRNFNGSAYPGYSKSPGDAHKLACAHICTTLYKCDMKKKHYKSNLVKYSSHK